MTVFNELRVLRHVHHPNIALLHGACFRSDGAGALEVMLVLEKVAGVSMRKYLAALQASSAEETFTAERKHIVHGICQVARPRFPRPAPSAAGISDGKIPGAEHPGFNRR